MPFRTILITGASRGLGAELACAYAYTGVHLFLTARTLQALSSTKIKCENKGARVSCFALDLEQPTSINQLLCDLGDLEVPDLVIANAGIFSGRHTDGSPETFNEQRKQISVNLLGTIQLVDPFALLMQTRKSGHIVLLSSLAAIQPQPDSPTYSASKAGLAAWGLAMGEDLAKDNVTVSVVYPGHIKSQQTDVHEGILPGLISAEKAATIIKKNIARRSHRIVFPRHIYWMLHLSNALPGWLRRHVNKPFRFTVQHKQHQNRPKNHE